MTPPKLTTRIKRRHGKRAAASGIGGAGASILLWVGTSVGVNPPPEIAGAFAVLVGYGASFLPEP